MAKKRWKNGTIQWDCNSLYTIPIVIGLDPDAVVVPLYDSAQYDNSDSEVHWFNHLELMAEKCVSDICSPDFFHATLFSFILNPSCIFICSI